MTIVRSFAAFALLAATASAYDVQSLTPENYEEITDGKTVFLKFFAPWVSSAHKYFFGMLMRILV